jgi:hypothetical protein
MTTEAKRDRIRNLANRTLGRISGKRIRAYSMVGHVGRISGREYFNPVSAYPLGDGFVIPVLYGIDSQWVRNVLAIGSLTLRTKGLVYALERPAIIGPEQALSAFPGFLQRLYRLQHIQEFIWAHKPDLESEPDTVP